jgi:hypothetical protein
MRGGGRGGAAARPVPRIAAADEEGPGRRVPALHRRIGHWYERTLTRERKDEIILRALTSAIDAFNAHTTPLPYHLVQHLLALASGKGDDV